MNCDIIKREEPDLQDTIPKQEDKGEIFLVENSKYVLKEDILFTNLNISKK